LLLWLGSCALLGLLFGWPVIAGSLVLAVGPTYLTISIRNYLIAFPFAVAGALLGALGLTGRGVISAAFVSLVTGIVVGLGLSSVAMWLRHWREMRGRSA